MGLDIAYVVGDGPMDVVYVTEARSPIDLVGDSLATHGLGRLADLRAARTRPPLAVR